MRVTVRLSPCSASRPAGASARSSCPPMRRSTTRGSRSVGLRPRSRRRATSSVLRATAQYARVRRAAGRRRRAGAHPTRCRRCAERPAALRDPRPARSTTTLLAELRATRAHRRPTAHWSCSWARRARPRAHPRRARSSRPRCMPASVSTGLEYEAFDEMATRRPARDRRRDRAALRCAPTGDHPSDRARCARRAERRHCRRRAASRRGLRRLSLRDRGAQGARADLEGRALCQRVGLDRGAGPRSAGRARPGLSGRQGEIVDPVIARG